MTAARSVIFLNYAVRVLVILIGLAILGGFAPFDGFESPFHEIFGVVVVLFGIYRIVAYTLALRRIDHE